MATMHTALNGAKDNSQQSAYLKYEMRNEEKKKREPLLNSILAVTGHCAQGGLSWSPRPCPGRHTGTPDHMIHTCTEYSIKCTSTSRDIFSDQM